MLTAWVLYSIIVTCIAALAARAGESALSNLGAHTRWSWVGGMGLAGALIALPWLPERLPMRWLTGLFGGSAASDPELVAGPLVTIGAVSIPASIPVGTAGSLARFDPWVAGGWLLVATGLAVVLAVLRVRLARRSRSWTPTELPEGPVLVSRRTGPAVFGLLRSRIVLPRWCLELPVASRRLILDHEREHRRARDPLLVAATGLAVLALPWNPPLWWMWVRLRGAVEVDCDARVTRDRPGVRRVYGNLLLVVGGRRVGFSPLATFSQHPSTLSRRIHMLTRSADSHAIPRSLILAAVALVLVALACVVPDPEEPGGVTEPESSVAQEQATAPDPDDLMQSPQFTPHDERPQILGRERLAAALEDEYPPELRDNGIGGTVVMHVFVDAEGEVRSFEVAEGSGFQPLDEAALRVSEALEFSPARNRGEIVPVWIQVPLSFMPQETDAEADTEAPSPPVAPSTDSDIGGEPQFTPHDERPRIQNQNEIADLMSERYPADLREAGIGGTVMVHIRLDVDGVVQEGSLAESSGHEALDAAALSVVEEFEFSPARNRGEAVPVWIQVPVTFTAG